MDNNVTKHPWTEISIEENALDMTTGGPISSYLHDLGQIVDVLRTQVSLSRNQDDDTCPCVTLLSVECFLSRIGHLAKGDSGSAHFAKFHIWSLLLNCTHKSYGLPEALALCP